MLHLLLFGVDLYFVIGHGLIHLLGVNFDLIRPNHSKINFASQELDDLLVGQFLQLVVRKYDL